MAQTQIPQLAITLTEDIACYLKRKFQQNIKEESGPIPFPKEWDMELLYESNLAAHVLATAFGNQSKWYVNLK
jgi:hypothetical protein